MNKSKSKKLSKRDEEMMERGRSEFALRTLQELPGYEEVRRASAWVSGFIAGAGKPVRGLPHRPEHEAHNALVALHSLLNALNEVLAPF